MISLPVESIQSYNQSVLRCSCFGEGFADLLRCFRFKTGDIPGDKLNSLLPGSVKTGTERLERAGEETGDGSQPPNEADLT